MGARNFPPPSPESIALVTQTALFQVLATLEALGGMGSPAAKLSVVYDRSGGVSTSQELDYARPIVALLEAHFPETLAKAFLYPIGGAFRLGWSVAKMIFDEETAKKLVLCGLPTDMHAYIESS